MPRLIWSPAALLDVQRLYRFLAPQNPDAAKRAVRAIRQDLKVLEKQPGMGRPVEEMNDEFRDWIIDFGDSGYVARYRVDPDAVTILAVRHQKEDRVQAHILVCFLAYVPGDPVAAAPTSSSHKAVDRLVVKTFRNRALRRKDLRRQLANLG